MHGVGPGRPVQIELSRPEGKLSVELVAEELSLARAEALLVRRVGISLQEAKVRSASGAARPAQRA